MACVLLALRALLPAQRARPLHRATAWPLSIALAGATLWQWAASRGWLPATVAIVAMAVALGTAYVRLQRFRQLRRADDWLVLVPVSLGWLTVACFVNLAALLVAAGVLRPGSQEAVWTVQSPQPRSWGPRQPRGAAPPASTHSRCPANTAHRSRPACVASGRALQHRRLAQSSRLHRADEDIGL